MIEKNPQAQIEGLATLLVLGDELRKVHNLREFGFFTTNETHRLIPYHTAFLWKNKEPLGIDVLAQSGTPEIDAHSPFIEAIKSLFGEIIKMPDAKKIYSIDLNNELNFKELLPSVLSDALPAHLLWCPFLSKNNQISGGLAFFREKPFTASELKMIRWLIEDYQYTWGHFNKQTIFVSFDQIKQKPYMIALGIFIVGLLLMPIRLSVLGTATVVPKDPAIINSPIDGVIKSFAVNPGNYVKKNQLLLVIDQSELRSSIEVLQKEYSLTQAKLRTAINEAYEQKEGKSEIPILQAQLAIDKAKIDYTQEKLNKTLVQSPIDGIVIFDSKEDWVGQPVETGEKILLVANPAQVELKILLPVANAIVLDKQSDGEFFLHGQLRSVPIKIKSLGYNAKLTPNRTLAYKLYAEFINQTVVPQLGAQGTVRLYGHRVPFIYYLLRRPLQSARQYFGV